MPHIIEVSKSGRAGCRKCKQKIAKDELRFGHEVPNAFDECATTFQWYHLSCAAEKLPMELEQAMDGFAGAIADEDQLRSSVEENRKKVKPSLFPYAEAAPSGRSGCLACGEKIAKGELRVAVEREVDAGGFARRGAGYLHPACCGEYEDIPGDLMTSIRAHSTTMEDADFDRLEVELSS